MKERELGVEKERENGEGRKEGRRKNEKVEVMDRMKDREKIRKEGKEDRKRNNKGIIIRRLEVKEEERKEAYPGENRGEGGGGRCEEIRKGRGREREMVWMRLKSEEQRNEVMKKKSKLNGRRERIVEDWIWMERRMR